MSKITLFLIIKQVGSMVDQKNRSSVSYKMLIRFSKTLVPQWTKLCKNFRDGDTHSEYIDEIRMR